jgi:hypothetical protein
MFYFPMAGLSSRFSEAGYNRPKYFLELGNINLFQASLKGFSKYFQSDEFCFIFLEKFIDEDTILGWANEIGLSKSNIIAVPLEHPTQGQADTVRLGIEYCAGSRSLDDEVIIFNIDTVYDDFTKPAQSFQNYLDVTKLSGDHWSFVVADPEKPAQAMHVEEKRRVSDLCSVGLYQFSSGVEFINAYSRTYLNRDLEQYVAPLYQSMIDDGHVIKFRELSPSLFAFLGTPQEYEEYMQSIRRT